MVRLVLCVLALSAGTSSVAYAQAGSGYWRASEQWEVTQETADGDCTLASAGSERDGIAYWVRVRVGDENEVVFVTSEQLVAEQAAIEFLDGGGLDFYELSSSSSADGFTLTASLSSSMMTRLLTGLREAEGAMYVAGSKGYLLPREPFEPAYQALRRCERRRLGMVLPD